MDFSIPPRHPHQGERLISVSNVLLFIRKCLLNYWTSQAQQCHPTAALLAKQSSLMNATKKGKTIFCFSITSLLLISHVVVADHHHAHSYSPRDNITSTDNNNNNNTNGNGTASILSGIRRSRYAGASSGQYYAASSSFILRPEFFLIPIGSVIHLFPRYGYLSLSMKVIAKNNTNLSAASNVAVRNDSWIFLEPVNNVIEPSTLKTEEITFSPINDTDSLPFHNLFHFDLCEDIRELLEAYFKNFSIEGLDKAWQAFAGGWRSASIARNFGLLNQTFVDGDYRYVLVKVLLVRGVGLVEPFENVTASHVFKSNFFRFQPDNDLSTYEFFNSVGTHYIHSYIAGNAMYQVFVYDPDGFEAVKKRLLSDGIKDNATAGSAQPILESMMRWMTYLGKVNILSATPDVAENIQNALNMQPPHSPNSATLAAPNLLKLHDNASLVKEIEAQLSSQPNGLLGIDLRGIQFLFSDNVQRAGFEKALKHNMQLWEINFLY